jgi:L-fuculose-phosphate aldolase
MGDALMHTTLPPDVADALDRLAEACRILAMEGHSDMTLGHVAWRDPLQRGVWIKRNRIGLDEVRSAADFVLVADSGMKLAGDGGVHSEWPIHAAILAARPDVRFTAHTHPLHASVLSGSGEALRPYTLDADYFTTIPMLRDTQALIVTAEEGEAVAQALDDALVVMLANHGVVFCGRTLEELVCVGAFLERAARAHLLGATAGLAPPQLDAEARARRHAQIMTPRHHEHSYQYFLRRLKAAEAVPGRPGPGAGWLSGADNAASPEAGRGQSANG